MSKKSFVKGAAILAVSGLIVKVIGAIFRIPLTNIIGTEGIGLYQLAYPIYAFLLVASTAGVPVAISKMVSEEIALGNRYGAYRVFRTALKLLTMVGIVTSIILFLGSGVIARLQGNPKSVYPLMAISPALLFVSIMSAYRGYFQGMHIMSPTALSQIVEQVGKLVLGLTLASLWLPRGPEYAAAGAVAGVTLSEVAALVLLLGIYRGKRQKILEGVNKYRRPRYQESSRVIISRIINIAVPVTIGASIMPLVNFIDQIIVVNRLKHIIDQVPNIPYNLKNFAGFLADKAIKLPSGVTLNEVIKMYPELYEDFAEKLATSLYGILTGTVNPLINFPTILTIALAMSLVPAVSESFALKDYKGLAAKTTVGVRLTLLVGLPAAVGLGVLAHPIIRLLYRTFEAWEYAHSGAILIIMSVGVIFLSLIQSLTAILQGVNRVSVPVRNLLIGAAFKVVVTFILVGVPEWNVRGAALGTVVCYGVAAILDFIAVIKYTGITFSFKDFVLKPALSTAVMGVLVYFIYKLGMQRLESNTISLMLSIAAGVVIYLVMLLVTGSLRRQDFEYLPAGKKLGYILDRLRLLKD